MKTEQTPERERMTRIVNLSDRTKVQTEPSVSVEYLDSTVVAYFSRRWNDLSIAAFKAEIIFAAFGVEMILGSEAESIAYRFGIGDGFRRMSLQTIIKSRSANINHWYFSKVEVEAACRALSRPCVVCGKRDRYPHDRGYGWACSGRWDGEECLSILKKRKEDEWQLQWQKSQKETEGIVKAKRSLKAFREWLQKGCPEASPLLSEVLLPDHSLPE